MYRKVSLKLILAIFFSLLVIVLLVEFFGSKKGERTFRGDLIEVSTDDVTQIQIFPKVLSGKSLSLLKEGDTWMVEADGVKYRADGSIPGSMISQLNTMVPKSVAATKKESWQQFEVTDSLGTRVKLFNNDKLLADLIIGKFSFSQPRNMTSYVRLANDKEVYSVDGFFVDDF